MLKLIAFIAAVEAHISNAFFPISTVTDKVFFDISIGGQKYGKIIIGLFGNEVPKTVKNFKSLSEGYNGLSYKGTQFFRIIPGMMAMGGDVRLDTGRCGKSIFGNTFADENFSLKHSKRHLLSMSNMGANTNNS